jgi:hypothetical protein
MRGWDLSPENPGTPGFHDKLPLVNPEPNAKKGSDTDKIYEGEEGTCHQIQQVTRDRERAPDEPGEPQKAGVICLTLVRPNSSPRPETRNPEPETRNPKPGTRNPNPQRKQALYPSPFDRAVQPL